MRMPLFSYEAEAKGELKIIGEEELTLRTISDSTFELLDKADEKVDELEDKASLPRGACILGIISVAVGIIGLAVIDTWTDDVGVAEVYSKVPWLFYLTVAGFLGFGLMAVAAIIKNKRVMKTEEAELTMNYANAAINNAYRELKVPEAAEEIDCFQFQFLIRNDKVKIKNNSIDCAENQTKRVFFEDGNLCLADAYNVYGIPLSSIVGIRKVKKRLHFDEWNREVKYNKSEYKPYKIWEDKNSLSFKNYYIMDINHPTGEYELYIAPYDIEKIVRLTGINPTEE